MSIQRAIEDESKLLDSFGADEKYNSTDSYSVRESFYQDGKYPPDWPQRRNAIWWLQDDACARCGTDHDGTGHVHHVVHLAAGGDNSLDNLVGLCANCHALLHPAVSDLNGDWRRAPKFPCEDAEPEVAVIRRSRGSAYEEKFASEVDLAKLAAETESEENAFAAQSQTVYATSASVARQFPRDPDRHSAENHIEALEMLSSLLLLRGRVPENAIYDRRRLDVETSLSGVLGWLSSFEPPIEVTAESASSDGPFRAVSEDVEPDGSADRRVIFSDDTTAATVTVEGGDGSFTRREVSFTDDERTRSVCISVSPPPLTASTAPSYAGAAVKRLVVLFVVVGLALTLLSPFL